MDPDLTPLDAALGDAFDGYLVDADGGDSDQRYLSGFDAPDRFVTLYTPDATHLLVSGLEYGRARKQSRADGVARLSEHDYRDRVREHGPVEGRARTVAAFLDERSVERVAVPDEFPLGTADGLRGTGIDVAVEAGDAVGEIRAVKTDEEIEHVRTAQAANEAAMAAAERLIRGADAEDGRLMRDGEALTSERVREEIEVTLLRHGCALDETIVACGADAADPHDRGSGPLAPDEPIVVDIFPRDKETGYHADMTRTFASGDPSSEIRRWHDLTQDALAAALDRIEAGVSGAAVHDAACEVYEDAGEPTQRSTPDTETGFIHSTGHGVGLDVHERPRLGFDGDELRAGNVITVEPGLYDPAVGGVRIEDLVVVTQDGYENLTDYPIALAEE